MAQRRTTISKAVRSSLVELSPVLTKVKDSELRAELSRKLISVVRNVVSVAIEEEDIHKAKAFARREAQLENDTLPEVTAMLRQLSSLEKMVGEIRSEESWQNRALRRYSIETQRGETSSARPHKATTRQAGPFPKTTRRPATMRPRKSGLITGYTGHLKREAQCTDDTTIGKSNNKLEIRSTISLDRHSLPS